MRLHELLDHLIEAKYTRQREGPLASANRAVESLRFEVRLAHDLRCLKATGYGHGTGRLDEIGRMVGGWGRAGGSR